MATTTVTAGKQAEGDSGSQTSWTAAKDATSATYFQQFSTNTDDFISVQGYFNSGRGGGTYRLVRTFLFFDLSSIPGTITAMDLDLYVVYGGTAVVQVAKSTAFGTNGSSDFVAADFDNWSQSSPTAYMSGTSTLSTGAKSLTLNSTAISDANSNGYLNVAIVDNLHDFNDQQPLINISRSSGIRFQTPLNPIQLDITYTPAYGNDVMGVASANIDNVIGVATANIGKIKGAQ
jgi:hypothetical protein